MTDDHVRDATRGVRENATDPVALGRLVVALWRADGLRGGRRDPSLAVNVLFKLSGGLTTEARRVGQSHPWPTTNEHHKHPEAQRKGLWWTVGPGPWSSKGKPERDGRVWIMPVVDTGRVVWGARDYCKGFDSLGELVDYLASRAAAWRVRGPGVEFDSEAEAELSRKLRERAEKQRRREEARARRERERKGEYDEYCPKIPDGSIQPHEFGSTEGGACLWCGRPKESAA